MDQLVLASQSPRRREMITWIGIPVLTLQANVEESCLPDESPADMAARLAHAKAQAARSANGHWILAADTVVDFENVALGKPRSPQEAQMMLRKLSGRVHNVHTGIALRMPNTNCDVRGIVTTKVWMRTYNDVEVDAYIASGDPMDKAGSYAIQHTEFAPVTRLDRCYANVVGLPLCAVAALLETQGFTLTAHIPQLCFKHFGYQCPEPDRGIVL